MKKLMQERHTQTRAKNEASMYPIPIALFPKEKKK